MNSVKEQSKPLTNSLAALSATMSKQQAMTLISRLLASYPGITIPEPHVYMAELAATLLRYRFATAERGIAKARMGSPDHIPSVGRIEAECHGIGDTVRETATYAKQWQQRASEQLRERAEYESRPRTPPKDDRPPHSRANVFVGQHLPQYAEMKTRSEAKDVNPNDFYFGHNGDGVVGIWVSLGWCERMMGGRRDSGLAHVSHYGAPG